MSGRRKRRGSDVNLGVHLVRDAFKGGFEIAAVLTNDTDLVEPIRIVTKELSPRVTLLTPIARPATSLARVATAIRPIQPYIWPLPDAGPDPATRQEADQQAGGIAIGYRTQPGPPAICSMQCDLGKEVCLRPRSSLLMETCQPSIRAASANGQGGSGIANSGLYTGRVRPGKYPSS
jgi:hypothetical protein